jgi:zinc protease
MLLPIGFCTRLCLFLVHGSMNISLKICRVLGLVGLVSFVHGTSVQAAVFYPTSFMLANGLQVVVVPNPIAPAVTQMVWYKVGSSDEKPGKTGLAHYLEHLMFRGTPAIPDGEFSKIIAAQGGNNNAFTSHDYTSYHETVAADRLPLIMQMEADRMQNLRITTETATPELSVVLNERHQRTDNNPEGKFAEKVAHIMLPHHPYGTPVIGWRGEVEKMTATDAREWYEHHYAPNNAVVIISGDVLPEDVMRLAAAIYGAVPRRNVAERRPIPVATMPVKKDFTMMDVGVEQPQIEMRVVVPSYSTQHDREAYAYEVLAEALDGGEIGLLYRYLVRELKIATAVETNYDPDARGDAVFTVAVSPVSAKIHHNVKQAVHDYLADLAQKGLDAEVIKAAKERMKRSAIFARDSLMMPGYSFGMALTTGHTVADVEEWPDRIDAVTLDQVNSALRDLVANPHAITASLLPDPHATAAAREAARDMISHDKGIR